MEIFKTELGRLIFCKMDARVIHFFSSSGAFGDEIAMNLCGKKKKTEEWSLPTRLDRYCH